jgi:hypothetical protein
MLKMEKEKTILMVEKIKEKIEEGNYNDYIAEYLNYTYNIYRGDLVEIIRYLLDKKC